ncbi:homoserine O-acetyltransferase MetX [Bartonella sp. DGB2]|uniref:homoserine O-acetyltransferase MetX n=1 Tax=Bartonella sp. DGB2 TaxID=3388426 RepID=UPI0039900DBC
MDRIVKSISQSLDPNSLCAYFDENHVLHLDSGETLSNFQIAYREYGRLNRDKSNAVLVCHGLTGDQYVASPHPITQKPGWWSNLVGPGKAIDTDRYYVICTNVLGGCLGSTGPASINPQSGKPYALDFPMITIGDMVRAQALLIQRLGIKSLFAIIGGSMGGMQVLEWAASYKERVFSAIILASGTRLSAQNIAFDEIGRHAIMADPDWCQGRYIEAGKKPIKGLAVARMTAHITYLSEAALHQKFGRNLQNREQVTFGFDADFQVESYLRHQGMRFVERFDANSYLYLTRAMDYFDLGAAYGGQLACAFRGSQTRFLITSFSSDWMFPTKQCQPLIHALNAVGAPTSFIEIETDKGHDAFLLDEPVLVRSILSFLEAGAWKRGLA